MSTSQRQSPSLEVNERLACMCGHGDVCTSFGPGHALHLIQARLAASTPSDWVDATVIEADAGTGVIAAVGLLAGERIALWSASGAAIGLAPGTPISVHARYDVLAIGSTRYNVRRD